MYKLYMKMDIYTNFFIMLVYKFYYPVFILTISLLDDISHVEYNYTQFF